MSTARPDLGAMLLRLARVVAEAEVPVLRGHGLEMWDYAVLSGLASGPTPTQGQLAAAVGRDQTRLIPILDRLEARGLLERRPDPRDRRNRVVSLTDVGADLLAACRSSVEALENELLAGLEPDRRANLLAALEELHAASTAR